MKSQCQMLEKSLRTRTNFIYYIIPSKPHTETKCITHKNQLHFKDSCSLETSPNAPSTSLKMSGWCRSAYDLTLEETGVSLAELKQFAPGDTVSSCA